MYANEPKYHYDYTGDIIGSAITILIALIFGFFLMRYMNREYRTDHFSNIEKS